MRSPLKVKVPGSVTTILPKDETLSNIAANWDRTREQMSKLLAGVSPNQAKYGVFPHPVGGCMNLPQSIDFLCAHLQHHKWQIKRLRRAAKHRPRQ